MEGKIKKVFMAFGLLLVSITVFSITLCAQEVITQRTGPIKITKPDGSVLTVGKEEALPDIPSGSTVEVLSGGIEVKPLEGFIQVVVGDSIAAVKAGDRATASMEPKKRMADFKVEAGQINIITGNTTTTVKAGQQVQIGLDRDTGVTEVKSIKGSIETVTVGVKVSVPQDAIAKISADAKTRNVHVESVNGYIVVTPIDGKVIMLAKAESIDTEAKAEGEIQTFAEAAVPLFVPVEEPAEPERPEASPFRP